MVEFGNKHFHNWTPEKDCKWDWASGAFPSWNFDSSYKHATPGMDLTVYLLFVSNTFALFCLGIHTVSGPCMELHVTLVPYLTHLTLDKMAAISQSFQMHFREWKFCILIKISLKFVPKGPIDNIPPLVQIMAWRQIGDKPLSEPILTQSTDAYWRP